MKLKNSRVIAGFLFLFFSMLIFGFPAGVWSGEEKTTILASQIMDQDVYNAKQENIGEVDDLIIRKSGRVKKLTLEFGGFLDIGDKLVAMPFKRFRFTEGKIILDVTEKDLQKKPEFDYFKHGLLPGYFRGRLYPGQFSPRTYYYQPYSPESRINPYDMPIFSWSRFLASVILDSPLFNENGQKIGTVKDLLINLNNDKVEKIILASMDIAGKNIYLALPYQPLSYAEYGVVYGSIPGKLKEFIYPYKE